MSSCRLHARSTTRPWNAQEVGPSFFETMNIPVLRGRVFTSADFERGRRLYVISEAFAKCYFPNEDPIGGRSGPRSLASSVTPGSAACAKSAAR